VTMILRESWFLYAEMTLFIHYQPTQDCMYDRPLLLPVASRSIVHSSICPKPWNNCRTSFSFCCLFSIPMNNFRSSVRMRQHHTRV